MLIPGNNPVIALAKCDTGDCDLIIPKGVLLPSCGRFPHMHGSIAACWRQEDPTSRPTALSAALLGYTPARAEWYKQTGRVCQCLSMYHVSHVAGSGMLNQRLSVWTGAPPSLWPRSALSAVFQRKHVPHSKKQGRDYWADDKAGDAKYRKAT
jgi:hypothetical protein